MNHFGYGVKAVQIGPALNPGPTNNGRNTKNCWRALYLEVT